MNNWIDVNDRLPDTNRYVWVTVKNDYIGGAYEVAVDWYDQYEPEWNSYDGRIVAWMEIDNEPQPYGTKQQKEEVKTVETNWGFNTKEIERLKEENKNLLKKNIELTNLIHKMRMKAFELIDTKEG